eukprot:12401138-Karenia_brevis.AAC.1
MQRQRFYWLDWLRFDCEHAKHKQVAGFVEIKPAGNAFRCGKRLEVDSYKDEQFKDVPYATYLRSQPRGTPDWKPK